MGLTGVNEGVCFINKKSGLGSGGLRAGKGGLDWGLVLGGLLVYGKKGNPFGLLCLVIRTNFVILTNFKGWICTFPILLPRTNIAKHQ